MKNVEEIVKVNTKDLENLLKNYYVESYESYNIDNIFENLTIERLLEVINSPVHNYFAKRYFYFFLMAACSIRTYPYHNNGRGVKNYLSSNEFYKDMKKFQEFVIYSWEEQLEQLKRDFTIHPTNPLNSYSTPLIRDVIATILNFNEELYEEYEGYFNKTFEEFNNTSNNIVPFTGLENDLSFMAEVNSKINAINYINVYINKAEISDNPDEYKEIINTTKNILNNFYKLNINIPYLTKSTYDKRLRFNNYYLVQSYFIIKAYLMLNYNYGDGEAEELTNSIIKGIEAVNDNSPIFLNLHVNVYHLVDKILTENMPIEWSLELAF